MNGPERDPRVDAIPDVHGHAKGEHKPFAEERPIPYTARMLFLWFYHACRRLSPRFLMVADHVNYLTFEDPAAVNLVRRALKLAHAGDLYGAAETAGVDLVHAAAVSEGLRKGMRYSIGAEVDNDPRNRPDAQNIVDAMRPDAIIRSVHFLPVDHPEHGAGWQWPFDNAEFKATFELVGTERVWQLYTTTLLEAIEKLPGHIVGHFYVPAKFGHWPDDATLQKYEDQVVDAAAARGMALELNARYFYRYFADEPAQLRRYRSANMRLMKKAKAKGLLIAVGSDAHSPKDQGGGFETVLEMLDAAGINEIAFPVNGRMARVALRATEEIRRQHAVTPPPLIGSSVSGLGRAELAARGDEMPAEPVRKAPSRKSVAKTTAQTAVAKKVAADKAKARADAKAPAAKPTAAKPAAAAKAAKTPAIAKAPPSAKARPAAKTAAAKAPAVAKVRPVAKAPVAKARPAAKAAPAKPIAKARPPASKARPAARPSAAKAKKAASKPARAKAAVKRPAATRSLSAKKSPPRHKAKPASPKRPTAARKPAKAKPKSATKKKKAPKARP